MFIQTIIKIEDILEYESLALILVT